MRLTTLFSLILLSTVMALAGPRHYSSNIPGDVNADGDVNIADINVLIDAILSSSSDLKFDVNGDGFVTPSDAIMILYHYFDAEQSGFNAIAADINGDGNISPADAIEALYIYFNVGSANTRSAKVDDQLDPQ